MCRSYRKRFVTKSAMKNASIQFLRKKYFLPVGKKKIWKNLAIQNLAIQNLAILEARCKETGEDLPLPMGMSVGKKLARNCDI